MVHQKSLNFHIIYNGSNLTVFDGLTNDNEIRMTINLKIEEHIYKKKNLFLRFFLYLFRDPLLKLSK
jgi:hypothetical protein